MRTQTKWAVVLGAAAAMTLSACITSFAATGWVEEDGDWYYYDNKGDAVENIWKKSAEGKYYYLGDDGTMVVSQVIDDEYYVDEWGARVTNQWRKLDSISDDSQEAWFYFGSNGKIYANSTKTIGGLKYIFGSDGEMQTGWQDVSNGNWYYYGSEDEGWRYTSRWSYLEDEGEDGEYWYYFPSSGARSHSRKQNVNGKSYYFNSAGQMMTGWVALEYSGTAITDITAYDKAINLASASNVRYLGEEDDGLARTNTWAYLTQPDDENSDEKWYWFNSNGSVFVGDGLTATGSIKKINSKFYGFNTNGQMIDGIEQIGNYLYCFGNSNDGALKTGKQTVSDTYDDTYVAYFDTSSTIASGRGKGVSEIKSSVLYIDGIRVEAPEDSKYAIVEGLEGGLAQYNGLVVNESGQIQTKKNGLKDGNDNLIYTDSNGYWNTNYSDAGIATAKVYELGSITWQD